MKSKYRFAHKSVGGLWELEESVRITQKDWEKFTESMTFMVCALKDFGKDAGFKDLGKVEGCIFDK